MTYLWVSVAVLGVSVLLSELIRSAARVFPRDYRIYLLEAASTFQLCCCTHELKLLGDSAHLELSYGLALTYTVTLVHLVTFQDATCNPTAALESVCRGTRSLRAAGVLIMLQFAAAVASQSYVASVWSQGLSDIHLQHQSTDFRCFDPLGGTLLEAAVVELACAFVFQAACMHVHKLDERLQVHFIAAVVTAAVYAGGEISGAVFNPVLAFSVQFPCSGHTYLEYCFVYWLGPVLGVVSCILLFEKIIPFLFGGSTIGLDVPAVQKKKTQ
ncbi:aquaporin-11 [Haplochromis burtoni]|uniref:Aquaporin n=1 Tax=Haplochromis burtoni TaxID=8153 RepID=A0A3Q2X2J1_HAPBU|nr:aquaporin-11 [Haplochromis burtoni]